MRNFLLTLVLALGMTTVLPNHADAKRVVVPKMYMFGFAASFNDTIVHFTDVMEVDSVWIESKNKFLLGRNYYSHQFRDYLNTTENLPLRTCVTFYAKTRAKAEKQLLKMRRLYGPSKKTGKSQFEVRYIDSGAFQYKTVDISQFDVEEEEVQEPVKPKKGKKAGKKPGKMPKK